MVKSRILQIYKYPYTLYQLYNNSKFVKTSRANLGSNSVHYTIFCIFLVAALYSAIFFGRLNILSQYFYDYHTYFYDDKTTLLMDSDSYRWLRYSEMLDDGSYRPATIDRSVNYPEGAQIPSAYPLLAKTVSVISDLVPSLSYPGYKYFEVNSDGTETMLLGTTQAETILTVGDNSSSNSIGAILIGVIFAPMLVIPLVFYFVHIGYPLSAIIGGVVGGMSSAYYMSTLAGMISPDSMTLFFMSMAGLFLLFTSSRVYLSYYRYLAVILSGVTLLVFTHWIGSSIFMPIYFVVLSLMLYISGIDIKEKILTMLLFLGFTGFGNNITGIYQLLEALSNAEFYYVGGRISEIFGTSFLLSQLAYLGFFSAIYMLVVEFRRLLPLLPVLVLAVLSVVYIDISSVYLGAVVGVGIGYILQLAIVKGLRLLRIGKLLPITVSMGLVVAVTIASIQLPALANIKATPEPDRNLYSYFLSLNRSVGDVKIYTWWDYGALLNYMGFTTFHDSENNETVKTDIIANSLLSTSQRELYNAVSYLHNEGSSKIDILRRLGVDPKEYMKSLEFYNKKVGDDVYLLLTFDMLEKFDSIADRAGLYVGEKQSLALKYYWKAEECRPIKDLVVLSCGSEIVNLELGKYGTDLVNEYTLIVNGLEVHSGKNNEKGDLYLIVKVDSYETLVGIDYKIVAILAEKDYYDSNIIQMMLLDRYDKSLFTEVDSHLPFAKLFKVGDASGL